MPQKQADNTKFVIGEIITEKRAGGGKKQFTGLLVRVFECLFYFLKTFRLGPQMNTIAKRLNLPFTLKCFQMNNDSALLYITFESHLGQRKLPRKQSFGNFVCRNFWGFPK